MGSGKSSFGRRLASQLGWDFVDTDATIEQLAGMTVAEIFKRCSEECFRALEKQVIEESAAREGDTVVSLGGGAVCREGVMEMLNNAGETLYLKMKPARLVGRMGELARARRPKIAGMNDENLLAYIEKTLPEREKYYNQATYVIEL